MDVYNILLATLKWWYKLKSLLQSCKVSYKALRIKKKLQSLAFWPIFALLCMGLLHEFCELRTEGWWRKPRLLLWTFHNCVIFLLSWPSRDNCIRENSLPSEHGAKGSTAAAPPARSCTLWSMTNLTSFWQQQQSVITLIKDIHYSDSILPNLDKSFLPDHCQSCVYSPI